MMVIQGSIWVLGRSRQGDRRRDECWFLLEVRVSAYASEMYCIFVGVRLGDQWNQQLYGASEVIMEMINQFGDLYVPN